MNASLDQPTRYGFLLIPDFSMLAFSSALEPLRMANYLSEKNFYEWQCLSIDGHSVKASQRSAH